MTIELLKILQDNNNLSTEQLAVALGKSKEEVEAALRKLEKEKIVIRQNTLINWDKVDSSMVSALIEIKVTPERGTGFDVLSERIYRYPEVKSLFLVSGDYDLVAIVEGESLREVAAFISEKLATLENVRSTDTHFMLKKYKQNGIILDDKDEGGERLVISP